MGCCPRGRLGRGRIAPLESHGKATTAIVGSSGDLHSSFVKSRDFRDDRKTQSAAVTIAVLDPIETLEDERTLLRWNSRAVVLH